MSLEKDRRHRQEPINYPIPYGRFLGSLFFILFWDFTLTKQKNCNKIKNEKILKRHFCEKKKISVRRRDRGVQDCLIDKRWIRKAMFDKIKDF